MIQAAVVPRGPPVPVAARQSRRVAFYRRVLFMVVAQPLLLLCGRIFIAAPVKEFGRKDVRSYALGRIDTRNPTAPVSSTAALNFTAQAKPFPAFEDEHDWRADKLNPFVPTAGSSIWLGNDLRNYTAHTIGVVIRYSLR
jgi:hypothetical protein